MAQTVHEGLEEIDPDWQEYLKAMLPMITITSKAELASACEAWEAEHSRRSLGLMNQNCAAILNMIPENSPFKFIVQDVLIPFVVLDVGDEESEGEE